MKLYSNYRQIAQDCKVVFCGNRGYEVSEGEDRHIVNIKQKRCTCRLWDLSGIPCPHIIRALMYQNDDTLTEMNWWYSKNAYLLTYQHMMKPLRGSKFWKVTPAQAIEPPDFVKSVGQPKVKRNQTPDEAKTKRENMDYLKEERSDYL
uniref:SWIM-type domain-containing protein n=1 Tax=Nicotiana tabacum TaxID=4097 RepID=A0A1S3ZHG3_TOBAC|nr:PREDICTED: uncharacterized protein LOC107786881 [Nicotiana tabacum]